MYGIPGLPTDDPYQKVSGKNMQGTLIKYSLIIASDAAWAKQPDTTKIVFQMAPGAAGSGGGSNGANSAWSGTDGGYGGNTSFGSYIAYASLWKGTGGIYSGANGYCAELSQVSAYMPVPSITPLTGGQATGTTNSSGGRGGDSKFGSAGYYITSTLPAVGAGSRGGDSAGNGGGAGGGSAASPISPLYTIENPAATYAIVIGAGGTAGAAPNAQYGTIGGNGYIEIWEYS